MYINQSGHLSFENQDDVFVLAALGCVVITPGP
jgi:hypothetical protein